MGTDILGHHIRTKLDCLTIEDGTAMLSQKDKNKLSTYAPQRPTRAKTSTKPKRKSKTSYTKKKVFNP